VSYQNSNYQANFGLDEGKQDIQLQALLVKLQQLLVDHARAQIA
jgi:hypothetical protein